MSTSHVYELEQQLTNQIRTVIEKLELKEKMDFLASFYQELEGVELPTRKRGRFKKYKKNYKWGGFGHFKIPLVTKDTLSYLGETKCEPYTFLDLDGNWLDEFNDCFEAAVQHVTKRFNLELEEK